MRASASAVAVALLLAGCAPAYPTVVQGGPAQAREPETPLTQPQAQPPATLPPAQSLMPQPSAGDQCGAAQAQALIGRPRTLIPVPLDPRRQRVACTTCPVTEDFDPGRLNFFFDAQSGLIRQVRCG